jgi:hypothetical protein
MAADAPGLSGGLEFPPHVALPVTAAFVLAPGVVFAFLPFPIIGMDRQAELGPVVVIAMGMPAIAVRITDDSFKGAERGR